MLIYCLIGFALISLIVAVIAILKAPTDVELWGEEIE